MGRAGGLLLLGCLCSLLLSGCFYEQKVTQVRFDLGEARCFQGDRALALSFTLVKEQRRPWGPGRFPDGGKPYDLAAYILIDHQGSTGEGQAGRIDLPLYRRGDFGNLEHRQFDCVDPNLLQYRVENGYGTRRKVTEGELVLTPPS